MCGWAGISLCSADRPDVGTGRLSMTVGLQRQDARTVIAGAWTSVPGQQALARWSASSLLSCGGRQRSGGNTRMRDLDGVAHIYKPRSCKAEQGGELRAAAGIAAPLCK